MKVEDLKTLYDYGYWANARLFRVITQLTPEQFTQPLGGTYESVRTTLAHILSAEWGWLSRCGGPERGPRLNPADYPTCESLMAQWSKVERHVRDLLSTLKDEDLTRKVEYTNPAGEKRSMPLGELLQHAANHGVHHRGQAALQLRLLGCSPGNIDILLYYAERRGVAAW